MKPLRKQPTFSAAFRRAEAEGMRRLREEQQREEQQREEQQREEQQREEQQREERQQRN